MKQQFVIDEKWMSIAKFTRVYAFYQAIPGPEATELACYFGCLCGGWKGGLWAGLGFDLPGFGIMLLLSWLYTTYGLANVYVQASFHGVQPCVAALILTSLRKMARHAFADGAQQFSYRLGLLGFVGLLFTTLNINFYITLAFCGLANVLAVRRSPLAYGAIALQCVVAVVVYALVVFYTGPLTAISLGAGVVNEPSLWAVFVLGLLAGLLTFGGAYTAVPFIRANAVVSGKWLTDQQFLDGIGLANVIPAPLVMFVTFVGFIAAQWAGAVLMTIAIFTPAFTFSIGGHHLFNRLIDARPLMAVLEGLAASVIGIVLVTACNFIRTAVTDSNSVVVFCVSCLVLLESESTYTAPILVAVCALAGQTLYAST